MKRFGSEEPGPPFNFLAMAQYESKPGGSYATGNAQANTGVGGGAGPTSGDQGGGAGEVAIVYMGVTPGVPLTVTVGAGGAAGTGGSGGAGNGGSGVIIIEEIYA